MADEETSRRIPYSEGRVINQLLHGHLNDLGNALRAIIIFGPLVTSEDAFDIDLLEIVDEWEGPLRYQAGRTEALPMRGRLYMNFLSSQEFETAAETPLADEEKRHLLADVLAGNQIYFEIPSGYAREILKRITEAERRRGGGDLLPDPLKLPVKRAVAKPEKTAA